MEKQPDIREVSARLKALGVILKIGREMSDAADFTSAAAIAANSPEVLLHFKRSAIFESADGKIRLAGEYGLFEPNPHSDTAAALTTVCRSLDFIERGKGVILKVAEENEQLSDAAQEALASLLGEEGEMLAVRLPVPGFAQNASYDLFWLIEFPGAVPGYVPPSVNLLAAGISSALFSQKFCRSASAAQKIRHHISKWKAALIFAAVLLVVMFIPVREQTNAEFVLRAPEITGAYALFDGPVANCFKQDGEFVKKGETVVEYDTSQLRFRLDSARNKLAEIQKEYDLENSASFSDRERLGRVPLLAARLDSAKVDVKEAQWYLDHARITAPATGILALADGRAELLKNRVLRTGDRIFDIYGGKGMTAEIRVNERDSSILLDKITASCFLYTQPELEIKTKIIDIRSYPEKTEQNVWCYKVLAGLESSLPLRYGMRGVAKIRGKRIALGYMLFKNAVLYLRWL
ncbi:MAG: efflux RND transporter periplasmic adaptor subunit [Lentisphaeria bacterium]|nr:efflux RND transporter periplasmic adaptor subunit [Lentisphaeria bacterium]